jgi:hypothetical protein
MNAEVVGPANVRRPGWVRALLVALVAMGLALGVSLMLLGTRVYTAAQVAHPVEIAGAIADFKEVDIEGGYAYNELWLADDSHVYTFDRRQLHPELPQRLYQDAPIHIWVDRGTTHVLALTLYDLLGLNSQTYTSPTYDDPTLPVTQAQRQGIISGVSGGGVVVVVLLWLLAARLTRRSRLQARARRTQAPRPTLAPAPAPFAPAAPAYRAAVQSRDGFGAGSWDGGARLPSLDELPTQPAPAVRPAANAPAYGAPPDVVDLPTQKRPTISPSGAYDPPDYTRRG